MPGIGGQDDRNGGSACSGIYTQAACQDELVKMLLDEGLLDDQGVTALVSEHKSSLN